MDTLGILVGKILPYVTIIVLAVGLVYRIRRWKKAAVANMALYPAASKSSAEMWKKVLGEVFMFSSFRRENQRLWWSTWLFHAALVLIIVGHSRLISDWPLRVLLGMSEGAVDMLSAWSGGAVGVIVLATLISLGWRRLSVRRVREISSGEDFGLLLLLLAIVITGNSLRFVGHFDITVAQAYFASLLTPTAIQVPASPMFLLHLGLVQVMLMYLPFGKLLHVPGVFFSKPLLAKDF